MADEYAAQPETKSGDSEVAPKKKPNKEEAGKICRLALKRYNQWYESQRENVNAAYEDLKFVWEDDQWPTGAKESRKDRPSLTVNRFPQFVHQVTGDMRQMKPGIKVVPVDSAGDKQTAEAMGGMCRYIENRSIASRIYTSGADSQVSCGIGAWRISKERGQNTFNQELRIVGVDDAVAIAVDPNSIIPTREDAKWMIVPVDMTKDEFEERYPDCPVEDFGDQPAGAPSAGWFDSDHVRVAEYWVKKPIKRMLALMPDGGIVDLTGKDKAEVAQVKLTAKTVEERESHRVCRYLITAAHVIEEVDWPGLYIPIVFAVGEEVRIGRKVVRRGLIRAAKDAQRALNYFMSAQAETVGLQPKAPFLVTEHNIQKYQTMWAEANIKNLPYLAWEPDPKNDGAPPQRVQPPVSSQGITEGIQLSIENMKAIIGIYDASLGQRSNETSGKAIEARQREGDTGSYVYLDNWLMAIAYTGTIIVDMVPHVYDTERQIRIMGEDGKIDLKWINRAVGLNEMDEQTGELKEPGVIENDVTKGAYDVVLETGPSYTTKRKEAKDSMIEFIRSAPDTAPVLMDLVAKAQDWPMADEFSKRLEAVAPPAVQKLIAGQKKERGEDEVPQEPDPAQQMQQAAMQLELAEKQATVEKIKAETAKIASEIGQQPGGDPMVGLKVQGEQQKLQIDAQRAELDHTSMVQEMDIKRQIAAVELEIKLADLAIKKQGLQLDTAAAALDLEGKQQGLVHDAEQHTAGLVRDMESHDVSMTQGAESHAAKIKQMNSKPKPTTTN